MEAPRFTLIQDYQRIPGLIRISPTANIWEALNSSLFISPRTSAWVSDPAHGLETRIASWDPLWAGGGHALMACSEGHMASHLPGAGGTLVWF